MTRRNVAAGKERDAPAPDVPLVTVLTPAFNTGRFIEETILSVRRQAFPAVEHLVLAGGSQDRLEEEILERHGDAVRVVRHGPTTLSPKLNLGFRLARGEIVGWLNADDVYLPNAVVQAVEVLTRDRELAMVYSHGVLIGERGEEIGRDHAPPFDLDLLLNEGNIVAQPTVFLRRAAVLNVGGVDERYSYAQDYDLWIRLARRYPVRRVDAYWGAHRIHPGQLTALHGREGSRELREISRRHGGRRFSPLWRRHAPVGRTIARLRHGDVEGVGASIVRELRRRGHRSG